MDFGIDADVTADTVGIAYLARAVEDAGLESLLLTHRTHLPADRVDLLADPLHRMDAGLLDPFVALGAAAAVTSQLKLGTGVCQVPLLDPILLAKQVVTLDHLSEGRFLFGVGAGWLEGEIRDHGVEPAERFEVMRERVLAMKAIWTQEPAEYHGRHVDFDPILLQPKPVQQPHPPILIGMRGVRGLEATLEYGDGWAPIVQSIADLEVCVEDYRQASEVAGRDPMPITVHLWKIDEALVERCAALGVARCVMYAFPEDPAALTSLLARWARQARRYD